MVEYLIAKTRVHIKGNVYVKGDIVDLSESDNPSFHLEQGTVIPAHTEQLPTEADGLFAEIIKERDKLKENLEQQKKIISRLTDEMTKKDAQISALNIKKK